MDIDAWLCWVRFSLTGLQGVSLKQLANVVLYKLAMQVFTNDGNPVYNNHLKYCPSILKLTFQLKLARFVYNLV